MLAVLAQDPADPHAKAVWLLQGTALSFAMCPGACLCLAILPGAFPLLSPAGPGTPRSLCRGARGLISVSPGGT